MCRKTPGTPTCCGRLTENDGHENNRPVTANFVQLGENVPLEGGHQTEASPPRKKYRYFTTIGSSSVKTVADRHRLAAYHSKHCRRAFRGHRSKRATRNEIAGHEI